MSSTSEAPAPTAVAWLDGALREAVAVVAGTEPDPTDPFRGLYISDG